MIEIRKNINTMTLTGRNAGQIGELEGDIIRAESVESFIANDLQAHDPMGWFVDYAEGVRPMVNMMVSVVFKTMDGEEIARFDCETDDMDWPSDTAYVVFTVDREDGYEEYDNVFDTKEEAMKFAQQIAPEHDQHGEKVQVRAYTVYRTEDCSGAWDSMDIEDRFGAFAADCLCFDEFLTDVIDLDDLAEKAKRDAITNALIEHAASDFRSASDVMDAAGLPEKYCFEIDDILEDFKQAWESAECDPEGPTKEQEAAIDAILDRFEQMIMDIGD